MNVKNMFMYVWISVQCIMNKQMNEISIYNTHIKNKKEILTEKMYSCKHTVFCKGQIYKECCFHKKTK